MVELDICYNVGMFNHTCEQCGCAFINGKRAARFCNLSCAMRANNPNRYRRRPYAKVPLAEAATRITIYRRRKDAGLAQSRRAPPRNEAIVDHWTDELAWLVGLIWSDGYLYPKGNTVEISSKDMQLIDLVMSLLSCDGFALKNRGRHVRVTFASPHIAQFLRDIGLTTPKSLTIGWPSMPDGLSGAFMRGLTDGDGSVALTQNRQGQQVPDLTVQLVTGSPTLAEGIRAWFDRHDIRASHRVRTAARAEWHDLYAFVIHEQASLKRLHGLLYPHKDVPCLHRKRVPFDQWLATPRASSGGDWRRRALGA